MDVVGVARTDRTVGGDLLAVATERAVGRDLRVEATGAQVVDQLVERLVR